MEKGFWNNSKFAFNKVKSNETFSNTVQSFKRFDTKHEAIIIDFHKKNLYVSEVKNNTIEISSYHLERVEDEISDELILTRLVATINLN